MKMYAINPPFITLGAYLSFGFLHRGVFEGGLKILLAIGHIPLEICLLVNFFFNATHQTAKFAVRSEFIRFSKGAIRFSRAQNRYFRSF